MTEHPADPGSQGVLLEAKPFRNLRSSLLDRVFAKVVERRYEAGEPLIRQGEPGDALLVVLEGTARVVVRHDDGATWPLAEVTRGDVVGEMALVTQDPTTADVVAVTHLRALALPVEHFHAIAATHPELSIVLTHLVADRLGRSLRDGLGGKVLDGYRIVGCVGRGAMAVVYEAREVASGRRVALKMMSHRLVYRPDAVAAFEHEARIVQSLEHPNVARLLGTFPAFRTWFLVMEFCDGANLGDLLERHGPFPENEARPILGQLASGLAYIHERGVVHRDLKPSNVLLTMEGRVKLTDFGLAKEAKPVSDDTQTLEVGFAGTPLYMAPEQMIGEASGSRVDVFPFACIAYELVVGRSPFEGGTTSQLLRQKLTWGVRPPPATIARLSAEMRELISRGLESDPERRPDSVAPYSAWAGDPSPQFLRTLFVG